MRKRLYGLRGRISGGGEFGEDLARLAERDTGAVLEDLCDAAVLWREGAGVVFEDFGVGVGVEIGCYGEEFWGTWSASASTSKILMGLAG